MTDEELDLEIDSLGFCGCGMPEDVLRWLLGVLEGMDVPAERMKVLPNDTVQDWFIIYQLDRLGLTEHGVSARWSWLTPRGRSMIGWIRSWLKKEGSEVEH